MRKSCWTTAVAVLAALALAAPATAQVTLPGGPSGPAPQPYGTSDFGGFRNVLPPGQNGFDNAIGLAQFELTGQRPENSSDQRDMYANLVKAAPGIQAAQLPGYFKDATFGVRPENVVRTYSPRFDVTIERDRFGVPHIYGSTRSGTMFGTGYATAEDRLFFIDVLRHLGRSQLSSFAGGAPANRDMDRQQFAVAPYTEEDLQKQIDQGLATYGELGRSIQDDATAYIAGINAYIAQTRTNPQLLPAEYAAINRPQGPEDFKQTDTVAIASLVGGIFGKGGGKELPWAQLLQRFQARLGTTAGQRAWLDFRDPDDPEAPTTVHGKRFAYRTTPRHVRAGSVAMPDAGSVHYLFNPVGGADERGGQGGSAKRTGQGPLDGLLAFPRGNSNALVVSARESQSGHPLAVFGPQVGYFAPQILVEQDVHGPGIDADGASFPGVNLYVELGHGQDYAWSATSAGQDIIDTFALPLCDRAGGAVTNDSTDYMYRGECTPMERLERTNSWSPSAADQTPPGTETITALRTKLGPVLARATVSGKPVVYTQLRSTYFHEIDSAGGFAALNDPGQVHDPASFKRAVSLIGYTFNWFYADSRHTAYFNSGNNPIRTSRTDPRLPVWGRYEWKNWDPDRHTATYTPDSQHPQVVDQRYMTSWNNKQAAGYAAPDTDTPYTSLYRSQPLDARIKPKIRRSRKMSLADLVNAMGDAGTVDLRGAYVLPVVLRVLSAHPPTPKPHPKGGSKGHRRGARGPSFTGKTRAAGVTDPKLRAAIDELRAWVASGAHRRDENGDGVYEHSDAIRIMDAWWPLLVDADLGGTLGKKLLDQLAAVDPIDNTPNGGGAHLGSAWDVGFYGTVQKDLRRLLGGSVRGKLSRVYCGGGTLTRCQRAIESSLTRALTVAPQELYKDATCAAAGRDGDQSCFDSISFRPLGAITQPLIPWINRPTFQQTVDIERGR